MGETVIRIVKYILVLAAVAMLYKTFYYDYKKQEIGTEVNASAEASDVNESEAQPVIAEEPLKTAGGENLYTDEANRTGWQSRKGMPIDRLGDTIGDSLKDKIKVKEH